MKITIKIKIHIAVFFAGFMIFTNPLQYYFMQKIIKYYFEKNAYTNNTNYYEEDSYRWTLKIEVYRQIIKQKQ
ncbi:MAG: hypothetical protein AB1454_11545 [Candidatus Auribacterota bacterium]